MKILGIESSTHCGSVAITDDQKIMGEYFINVGPRHSEKLVKMIDRLLESVGIGKHQIDAVLVSRGPGSFTSLRVGMSIGKGIAYALGKRISSVSSLDILAYGIFVPGKDVCSLIDAGRGEVYAKIVEGKNPEKVHLEETLIDVGSLCEKIERETVFVGPAAEKYKEVFIQKIKNKAYFAPSIFNVPRASTMCVISFANIRKGLVDDVYALSPNYMRDFSTGDNRKKNTTN